MTAERGKINAFQLYSLFFISGISSVFTFLNSDIQGFGGGEKILNFIPLILWGSLAAAPVFAVAGRDGGETIVSRSKSISPVLSKPIAVLYCASGAWAAALGLARLDIFLSTQIFDNRSVYPYMLIFIAVSVFSAAKGLEAMGRAAVIFSVFLFAAIALITGVSFKEIDFPEFPVFSDTGVSAYIKDSFFSLVKTAEIFTLFLLMSQTAGRKKTGYFIWISSFALVSSFIFAVAAGVMGEYGERQEFQFYALTSIAGLQNPDRMDDILSALWILCSLVKTMLFVYFGAETLNAAFEGKNRFLPYYFIFPAVSAAYTAISSSAAAYKAAADIRINGVLFALLVFIIPLSVMLKILLRNKKLKRNRSR